MGTREQSLIGEKGSVARYRQYELSFLVNIDYHNRNNMAE